MVPPLRRNTGAARPTGGAGGGGHGLKDFPEPALLALVCAGRDPKAASRYERDAFRVLFDRHQGMVANTAWLILRDPHHAEDVAQEVFVKLYQNACTISGRVDAWLRRVTVNESISKFRWLRRRHGVSIEALHEAGLEFPDSRQDPVAETRQRALARAYQECVEKLPASLRVPWFLRMELDLSAKEVGRLLGLTFDAVNQRVSRARSQLRQCLKAKGWEPS